MGNSTSAYTWSGELQQLCSEHEEADEKNTPKEYKRSAVAKHKKIGKGFYGPITKCTIADQQNRRASLPMSAVCKAIKGLSKDEAKEMYLGIAQMAQVPASPNIVQLMGVVTSGTPPLLLLEFCDCGGLDTYITQKIGMGTSAKLSILAAVSDGMAELEALGFVHRNLCARNVLVADGGESFKVSDWGRKGTDVRRFAVEVFETGKFSHASDVWAFALLAQEVFQDGQPPFSTDWDDHQVKQKVTGGFRPKQHEACPDDVYELQQKCWASDADTRPDFFWLRGELEDRREAARSKELDSADGKVVNAIK
eukprot:m.20540 g.20540  ORF g.20540 m.20540 type:complete len:309 (-) comp12162_c0_seq1:586-1512(-)